MGKSFRKPIIKDKPSGKKDYWKTVRKSAKQKMRTFASEEDLEIITGHSSKMKGIVLNVLDEYKLPYTIGDMFNKLVPKITFWTR